MASGRNIAPDEAFAAAYSYAIPEEFRRLGHRRFGFHGINHQHVSESMAQRWRQQGVGVLALTGGISEHDDQLRAELKDSLSWLCDMEILVIPADEEGMIARLCRRHCDAAVSAAIG